MKQSVKRLICIAAIVLAVLILFCIVRSAVNKGLGAKVEAAAAEFYRSGNIGDSLAKRLDAADKLQNTAARFDAVYSAYSELRNTNNALLALVNAKSNDLSEMYALNNQLSEQFVTLRKQLEPITEGKAHDALAEYQTAMDEAQAAIDRSFYNDDTANFYKTVLNRFPNNILKALVKADMPNYWEE